MRTRTLAANAALLVAATGLIALPQQAFGAAGNTLYVDGGSSACSNSGAGAQATPYCTIQAAANVATAGDTVLIAGDDWGYSTYTETVMITNSGTSAAPITFRAEQAGFAVSGATAGFVIKGSYVHVVGAALGANSGPGLVVSGSNDLVDQSWASAFSGAAVHFTGTASGDTIERSHIGAYDTSDGIQVDSGAAGITASTNYLFAESGIPVRATGGTGLNVTSNTFTTGCGSSVSFTNVSQASIEDNVFASVCYQTGSPVLAVDSTSSVTATVGYNVLSTSGGVSAPYSWAGTTYTTAAAFQAATGQGTADAVVSTFDTGTASIPSASPAIDSANADAPGELSTDINGNPRVDDAAIADTGTGTTTYFDRGAVEYAEFTSAALSAHVDTPQRVSTNLWIQGFAWGRPANLTINWGDGTSETDDESYSQINEPGLPGNHMYASRGTYTITATLTDAAQTVTKSIVVSTTGSTYTAVAPTRVLDTRTGNGAAKAKVAANGTVAVNVVSGVSGAPDVSMITAVVLNVTVTSPTAAGFITAYPYGGSIPASSNLNFSRGETVPNLVTVKVGGGKVNLRNASAGTSDLIADVQGYYVNSASGSGYVPVSPVRLLDTRVGTGAAKAAVASGGTVALKIEGAGPIPASGVSAVAVNVTATQPKAAGFITAYPDGGAAPNASDLNFTAGETVPNLVIVKVGADGKINLRNSSSGTVQLIADVAGYYTASGGDAFVPTAPTRLLDTRNGIGQESVSGHVVAPNSNAVWWLDDQLQDEAALVLNVTVTNPKAAGFITAHPSDSALPNASNLNFTAGETVPNLVMVDAGKERMVYLHNSSAGTTDLIADLFGYFS